VETALSYNPDLAAARKVREANGYDVRVARGQRLPTLSGFVSGVYDTDLGSANSTAVAAGLGGDNDTVQLGARLTLPLYQGGGPAAQVRQSQAREQQAMEQETAVERDVIAQTRSLFASWQASNEVIASSRVAVDAAALSLQGVRAENTVGTRTILDILNAEQEAFISRVQLVTAERNAYVASFSLLAAMNRIDPADFGIAASDVYDPAANFDRVKGKWSDWSDDATPRPISPRTVDSPAQNATISADIKP
jgi:outer membrane protein